MTDEQIHLESLKVALAVGTSGRWESAAHRMGGIELAFDRMVAFLKSRTQPPSGTEPASAALRASA